jgi:hypothetical protein
VKEVETEECCGSRRGFEPGLGIETAIGVELLAFQMQRPRLRKRPMVERDPRRMMCCQILRSMPATWPIETKSAMRRVGAKRRVSALES